MMEGVIQRGTGRSIASLGRPLAGKTGTTNDSNDAWFVGFSPDLVCGVYVGFDQPKSLGKHETGATVAAPAFKEFMAEALKDQPAIPVPHSAGHRDGARQRRDRPACPRGRPQRHLRSRSSRAPSRPIAAPASLWTAARPPPFQRWAPFPPPRRPRPARNPPRNPICRRPLPQPAPAAYIEPGSRPVRRGGCAQRSRRSPTRFAARWHCCGGIFDWDNATRRLAELNALVEDPKLWDDSARAQGIMRERTRLDHGVNGYLAIERTFEDALELAALADAEGDTGVLDDAQATLARLREDVKRRERESLLSGEADSNDSYVEVHAGQGGTEAQDWAEMLLRMYTRWADQHGYKIDWLEESPGEGAGIKSATVRINGPNAYGWLKTESGVHRLVRISPFDANARRHTSFASIWVYPVIDDKIEVEVQDKYLRVDTYRSSGAGGQHVNKTDSAVRFTYTPPRFGPDRRRLPERALAAPEPCPGDGHAQGAPL